MQYLKSIHLFCKCMPMIVLLFGVQTTYSKPFDKAPRPKKSISADSSTLRITPDGHWLGYINPDAFFHHPETLSQEKNQIIFPSYYDARLENIVTPVKDQGNCGSCWIFSTMGCLESNLLRQGFCFNNLSEQHLNTCSIGKFCEGGNSYYSVCYFSSLKGPMTEKESPYDLNNSACNDQLSPNMYVLNACFIPNKIEAIKEAVLNYGAVATNFFWDDYYFRSSDKTYYCDNSNLGTNHGVTIVGWDDLLPTKGGTGAWIVKNSWGGTWGDLGYFHMSFHDKSANTLTAYYPDVFYSEKAYRSEGYNQRGYSGSVGYRQSVAYGLVKLVPEYDLNIDMIGSWIVSDGAKISIDIYDNFNGSTLSNRLGTVAAQTVRYSGFRTFKIEKPIARKKNDDYYVLIRYETPGYYYPVPYDDNSTRVKEVAWVSRDGTSWSSMNSDGNISVRVFTSLPTVSRPKASIGVNTLQTNCCGQAENNEIELTSLGKEENTKVTWEITPSEYHYICGYNEHSNPTRVAFLDSGTYQIDLKVQNELGADSARLSQPVHVMKSYPVPFSENFNSPGLEHFGWGFANTRNETEWKQSTVVRGSDGNPGVMEIDYYQTSNGGHSHDLTLPPISLKTVSSAYLKFKVAYRYCCPGYKDRLEVWVSSNCGESFSDLVYEKAGHELSTVLADESNYLTRFIPNEASQWRLDSIDLSAFIGRDIIIQFKTTCSGYFGNMIYLDDPGVSGNYLISGSTLYYRNGKLLTGTTVELINNRTQKTDKKIIAQDGSFRFDELKNSDYVLSASLDTDAECISATDALMANLNAIGRLSLDPVQKEAGDVDNNGTISATDALLIGKYAVGLIDEFPAGKWFFDSKQVKIENGSKQQLLEGIYYGDINCSFNEPVAKAAGIVSDYSMRVVTGADSTALIPVAVSATGGLGAISVEILYPGQLMSVLAVSCNQPGMLAHIVEDRVKIAWIGSGDVGLDRITFFIKIKMNRLVSQDILLNLDPRSEFADNSAKHVDEARVTIPVIDGKTYASTPHTQAREAGHVLNCYPNPCNNVCSLKYNLTEGGNVRLSLFNSEGKLLKVLVDSRQPGGNYTVQISLTGCPDGIYPLTMEIGTSEGKKIIKGKIEVKR